MAPEVLLVVSYETGPCTRNQTSHTKHRQPDGKKINMIEEQVLQQKGVLIGVTALETGQHKLVTDAY
jgi:hypothetical protein